MESKIRIGKEWKTLVELPNNGEGYVMVAIGNDRIAFVGGDNVLLRSSYMVDVYNLKTKERSSFKMKEKRSDCAAVAIDEKLFVFGGVFEGHGFGVGCLSACEMFDLCDPSHKSHCLPPMPEAKKAHAAVVYDNTNVVVLGGYNGNQDLGSASMLDTINKKWIELPSMPTPRSYFAVGVSGSYIIAAGGCRGSSGYKTVEILDMQTRTWKGVANMNEARLEHGGIVIGNSKNSFHRVVVGGCNEGSCEIYSFKNNSWSSLPVPQFTSHRWKQLIVMDGKLIAGGRQGLETLDLSTPELIYELVHFVVELDIFSSRSRRKSCKPK